MKNPKNKTILIANVIAPNTQGFLNSVLKSSRHDEIEERKTVSRLKGF